MDLGLKPETADMVHQYIESEWDWFISPCDWNHCTMSEELIPAWSLHRLMEILDAPLIEFNTLTYNPYEEIIDLISECLKLKCITNKEYLKL